MFERAEPLADAVSRASKLTTSLARFMRLPFLKAAAAALLAAILSILLVCAAASQGKTYLVHTDHKRGDEETMKISHDEGPQVDGSTYMTEGIDETDGGWVVENPDGTQIAQVHYGYMDKDGNWVNMTTDPVIFTTGEDCEFTDKTARTAKECRPDKENKLVIFEVTYYEYTCKGKRRRISRAVPTEQPCDDNDYRRDALAARDWGEEWPYRGVQPPPPPPPAAVQCTATPQGRIKPIYVGTDPKGAAAGSGTPGYMWVIWIDEKGNQFTAIYKPDGTGIWEAAGTIPPRPSKEDVTKGEWQLPPEKAKEREQIIKDLEKAVGDPEKVRQMIGASANTGALSNDEFREYVNKLLGKPLGSCEALVSPPAKTVKDEIPKGGRPRKEVHHHKTRGKLARAHANPSSETMPNDLGPAIETGVGIAAPLLGGVGRHHGDSGGDR